MPAKCTLSNDQTITRVIREIKGMKGKKILVGPACSEGSEMAKIAGANEFGATIRAKKGFLAIPLTKEAKGKSPKDFPDLEFIPGTNKGYGYLARKTGKGQIERLFILKKEVKIPERAFLRGTFDKRETHDKAERILDEMMMRMIEGTATSDMILNALGASYVASVKQRIASNIQPSNSALTLSLKRGSNTLIDEGHLLKSISFEVV